MPEGNYWGDRKLTRRAAIRGAGLGVAGLSGAVLVGCGGGDDGDGPSSSGGTVDRAGQILGQTPAAGAEGASGDVRIPPGLYEEPIPPTAAEADPLTNGRYGGTLLATYLDPPRMDINRTLSCTIYTTMNYTNNKVVRGKTGASAHPFLVEIEPDLAESWEVSPDSMEFTFHIRPGIKTHNVDPTFGREYLAEDIALSMERYKAGGSQQDVFASVASIETPDDHTVKVTLSEPIADFATNIAAWSFMWVKELIEDEERLGQQAIGTGPFMQEEWTPKERSVFIKHPEYFETGLPFLDRVITVVQSDAAALRAGFQTHNFFGWTAADSTEWRNEQPRIPTMAGWAYPVSRGANTNGWHYQMRNPKFQDERVRRAISLAFDRNEFDLARNEGENQSPDGAFSLAPMPWILLYDSYPTGAVNGPWYQFDPEQATQLMEAAGYSESNPLTWEHVTWYDRAASAETIIPGLQEVLPSVRVGFRQVDNPTQVTMLSDRSFEDTMGIVWGPAGFSMDQWIYPWWHTEGGLNYNSAGNAELDALLEEQRAETDPEAKKEVWHQVWDVIHDQVWDFWWPSGFSHTAWHNYVLNYRNHGWMGSWSCYSSDQFRAVWLDEGHQMQGQ